MQLDFICAICRTTLEKRINSDEYGSYYSEVSPCPTCTKKAKEAQEAVSSILTSTQKELAAHRELLKKVSEQLNTDKKLTWDSPVALAIDSILASPVITVINKVSFNEAELKHYKALVLASDPIATIKHLRTVYNISLKDAKDLYEHLKSLNK